MLYSQVYAAIREQLKKIRKNAGLSQTDLAYQLDKGQSYVSKVERGDQYIDLYDFILWCKACGQHPSEVVQALDKFADSSSI